MKIHILNYKVDIQANNERFPTNSDTAEIVNLIASAFLTASEQAAKDGNMLNYRVLQKIGVGISRELEEQSLI